MVPLVPQEYETLRSWFLPDRPGPLVGLHVLQTGQGSFWVNRWPEPAALLAETGGNYALLGDASVLEPRDLQGRISGVVDALDVFMPLLQTAFPGMKRWERIVLAMKDERLTCKACGYKVRRLQAEDGELLENMSESVSWISKTWGGPAGVAKSGHAWAVVGAGKILAVACSFFVGERYEDVGVVTEPAYRGQGLGVTCAQALCGDIVARGRRPSWTTAVDNKASRRLAAKLGFQFVRYDHLYVINQPIPAPPKAPG